MINGVCKCGEGVCCTGCGSTKIHARGLCALCYKMTRLESVTDGVWQSKYVDAAPALEHLERLYAAGMTRLQVVKLTGLHHTTIYRMLPGSRVATETLAKVLAIEPTPELLATGDDQKAVSALGTARRLQALSALGWPLAVQAQHAGLDASNLSKIARGARLGAYPGTEHAVRELYDKLSATPGPSDEIRQDARERGWVPPLAWDEDPVDDDGNPTNHIDNPDAVPQGVGPQRKQPLTVAYREFRSLGYRNDDVIAARLQVEAASLRKAMNKSRDLQSATA